MRLFGIPDEDHQPTGGMARRYPGCDLIRGEPPELCLA
jgi:hypothetical protein